MTYSHFTRNVSKGGIFIPQIKTTHFGIKSLRYSAAVLWNNFIKANEIKITEAEMSKSTLKITLYPCIRKTKFISSFIFSYIIIIIVSIIVVIIIIIIIINININSIIIFVINTIVIFIIIIAIVTIVIIIVIILILLIVIIFTVIIFFSVENHHAIFRLRCPRMSLSLMQ